MAFNVVKTPPASSQQESDDAYLASPTQAPQ
jgi:hypothetical protein